MMDPAQGSTVGDTTHKQIRNDIIFGRLKPQERLKLDALKKRYNASVTTLREILNRLTSEGFVIAEGQKGFAVAPVSDADLVEIADLRILLECHALEKSFAAGDVEWEGKVIAAHHKLSVMEGRMMAGEAEFREQWKRFDWEFHHALIQACGSRALLETHGAIFDKYLRYQMQTLTFRGEVAAMEHRELRDAALARDVEKAKTVLRKHIQGGVDHSIASRASALPGPGASVRRTFKNIR